jgi:hypothetical protein
MGVDEGQYYFYSGIFGGSGSWMMSALVTLQLLTAQDWAKGFEGARVDDESYLNRYFWEQPPSLVLTSAFMYPEPPSDATHPWLWTNFGRAGGERAGGAADEGGRVERGCSGSGAEGGVCGGGGAEEGFVGNVLRGEACRRMLEGVKGMEEYGRGGVREAGEWEGIRVQGPGSAGLCWNITGARRWFAPVILNLSKDKRVLFEGSDKSKVLVA